MGRLDGKVAVITGGADGIGLGTAKLFAKEGATVIIVDIDQAALDVAVPKIQGVVDAQICDITKINNLQALRAHIEQRYGKVDILFANAGTAKTGLIEDVSEEDYDLTVDTNLKGTFFTVQKLLPLMPSGSSVILNTSIQAIKAFPGLAVYAATKAAVRSLARALTVELNAKGIRTNAVAPGYINTDIRRKVGMSEEMIREDDQRIQTQVPMGRIGTPEDIAKAVLFLSLDESSYISGVELAVDGGTSQI